MTTNKPLVGCDSLREWLISQGFHVAQDCKYGSSNECNWYAYRKSDLPARACECNNDTGMQLVVNPYRLITPSAPSGAWESIEVEVTGESRGAWFKLQAYSLTHDELHARLGEIESCLIAAWNALRSNDDRGEHTNHVQKI